VIEIDCSILIFGRCERIFHVPNEKDGILKAGST